jgi:hypothetical protein
MWASRPRPRLARPGSRRGAAVGGHRGCLAAGRPAVARGPTWLCSCCRSIDERPLAVAAPGAGLYTLARGRAALRVGPRGPRRVWRGRVLAVSLPSSRAEAAPRRTGFAPRRPYSPRRGRCRCHPAILAPGTPQLPRCRDGPRACRGAHRRGGAARRRARLQRRPDAAAGHAARDAAARLQLTAPAPSATAPSAPPETPFRRRCFRMRSTSPRTGWRHAEIAAQPAGRRGPPTCCSSHLQLTGAPGCCGRRCRRRTGRAPRWPASPAPTGRRPGGWRPGSAPSGTRATTTAESSGSSRPAHFLLRALQPAQRRRPWQQRPPATTSGVATSSGRRVAVDCAAAAQRGCRMLTCTRGGGAGAGAHAGWAAGCHVQQWAPQLERLKPIYSSLELVWPPAPPVVYHCGHDAQRPRPGCTPERRHRLASSYGWLWGSHKWEAGPRAMDPCRDLPRETRRQKQIALPAKACLLPCRPLPPPCRASLLRARLHKRNAAGWRLAAPTTPPRQPAAVCTATRARSPARCSSCPWARQSTPRGPWGRCPPPACPCGEKGRRSRHLGTRRANACAQRPGHRAPPQGLTTTTAQQRGTAAAQAERAPRMQPPHPPTCRCCAASAAPRSSAAWCAARAPPQPTRSGTPPRGAAGRARAAGGGWRWQGASRRRRRRGSSAGPQGAQPAAWRALAPWHPAPARAPSARSACQRSPAGACQRPQHQRHHHTHTHTHIQHHTHHTHTPTPTPTPPTPHTPTNPHHTTHPHPHQHHTPTPPHPHKPTNPQTHTTTHPHHHTPTPTPPHPPHPHTHLLVLAERGRRVVPVVAHALGGALEDVARPRARELGRGHKGRRARRRRRRSHGRRRGGGEGRRAWPVPLRHLERVAVEVAHAWGAEAGRGGRGGQGRVGGRPSWWACSVATTGTSPGR